MIMKMMTIYNWWWRESRLGGKAMLVLSAYQHGLTHSITSYVRVIWYPRIYTHRQQQQQHPHNSNRLIHKLFLFLLYNTFYPLLLAHTSFSSLFLLVLFVRSNSSSLSLRWRNSTWWGVLVSLAFSFVREKERKYSFIHSSYGIATTIK